jgi:hypothetical protein
MKPTLQQHLQQYSKAFEKANKRKPNAKELAATRRDYLAASAPVPAQKAVKAPAAKPEPMSPEQRLDLEKSKLDAKRDDSARLLKASLERQHFLEKENAALLEIASREIQPFTIEPKVSSGTSEAIAFMIASDWHNEERVLRADVSDQNEYNLEIFSQRSKKFFQGGQRLWDIMRRDQNVPTIVLGLLGDFITGDIHEDSAETNLLLPTYAAENAQDHIASGINLLLESTDADLIIPCHTGNHGRTTKQQRIATEQGHSLERMMYKTLAMKYEKEPRVKFQIADGYHSFLRIPGQGKNEGNEFLIRLHHGHHISYGGGVGGITIPVLKAISNWNTQAAYRNVNLDIFGHFHQYINYGSFVCNGSLIGYNAYANSIKASFERPQQAFFMVSRKEMAKTMSTPIFVE